MVKSKQERLSLVSQPPNSGDVCRPFRSYLAVANIPTIDPNDNGQYRRKVLDVSN